MQTRNDEAGRSKVMELIADIQVAQLVTRDAGGKLHSRPMVAKQHDRGGKGQNAGSGELWFFTSGSSGKIEEIEAYPEVLLNYADPSDQTYVAVLGDAAVVRDRSKIRELWSEPMRVWFPKGADDPDIALLRVEVREAEYWDSPSSALVYVYGYAKAVTTGNRPDPGDTAHVDFKEREG